MNLYNDLFIHPGCTSPIAQPLQTTSPQLNKCARIIISGSPTERVHNIQSDKKRKHVIYTHPQFLLITCFHKKSLRKLLYFCKEKKKLSLYKFKFFPCFHIEKGTAILVFFRFWNIVRKTKNICRPLKLDYDRCYQYELLLTTY